MLTSTTAHVRNFPYLDNNPIFVATPPLSPSTFKIDCQSLLLLTIFRGSIDLGTLSNIRELSS